MLSKRTLALLGLGALTCVALITYRIGIRADADTEETAAIHSKTESPLSPGVLDRRTTSAKNIARADRTMPAQNSDVAGTTVPDNPVYLESIGVIERLQKSRHGFYAPVVKGVPQPVTFRFTLDRQPLVELASRQETVAWPVNDGGVEFVKLTTLREQDGNLFIGGDVVDGQGQFAMVMSKDNSMSGQLLSPRGLYSYNSQLDEIVGQRVEGPVNFD